MVQLNRIVSCLIRDRLPSNDQTQLLSKRMPHIDTKTDWDLAELDIEKAYNKYSKKSLQMTHYGFMRSKKIKENTENLMFI